LDFKQFTTNSQQPVKSVVNDINNKILTLTRLAVIKVYKMTEFQDTIRPSNSQ